MNIPLPKIIQGGMGAGVSNWRLARAVSSLGQLGVVAGTALDQIMARRLQDGDAGGHVRRALEHFPFPEIARKTLDSFFIQGGKSADEPYRNLDPPAIDWRQKAQELCMAANFVEVFLAREGHTAPVGINYLEKIQLTLLPSIYGAMLAGVAVVIMGAGIPTEIPGILDQLACNKPVTYPVRVVGAPPSAGHASAFDPSDFATSQTPLPSVERPAFLPIVASDALAGILLKKASGRLDGFVIEGSTAGGHNAPPRGKSLLTPDGQPIYGPRDTVNIEAIKKHGLPFWLAGSYGSPEKLREALAVGATGIQMGTAFALCAESDLQKDVRKSLLKNALAGKARVFTDSLASPTGFPFKVALLEGTLSEPATYAARKRVCDLGYLRDPYLKDDGSIGYRCAAEPVEAFQAKKGKPEDAAGRKCLCNALLANIGIPQTRAHAHREPCLVTLGDDLAGLSRFCREGQDDYTAADVLRIMLDEHTAPA